MRVKSLLKKTIVLLAIFIVLLPSFSVPIYAAIQPWTGNPWSGDPWSGDPWKGDPWKGNTWEGSPWEGNGTKGNSWGGNTWTGTPGEGNQWSGNGTQGSPWNGSPWTGNSSQGNGWTGNGTQGNQWSGNQWSGNGGQGNGWNGNGTQGNQWSGNQWSGNGGQGNGWNGNGTQGNQWSGNQWNGNGGQGNGWTGNPWVSNGFQVNGWPVGNIPGSAWGNDGRPWINLPSNSTTVYKPTNNSTYGPYTPSQITNNPQENLYSTYDKVNFLFKDVAFDSYFLMKDNNISLIDLKDYNPTSKEFYNQFFKNSFKYYFKGVDGLDPVFDAIDAGDKYKEFRQGYDIFVSAQRSGALGRDFAKLLHSSRNLYQKVMYSDIVDVAIGAKNAMNNAATTFSGLAPLAKLNVVSSVIGAGLSGYETIDNIGKLMDANGGKEKREAGGSLLQSSGEFFMNVGAGTAAFPGGQAVGAALLVGGALLWGVGTVVKNWDKIKGFIRNPGKSLKNFGKQIKDKASQTWKAVKGWFS